MTQEEQKPRRGKHEAEERNKRRRGTKREEEEIDNKREDYEGGQPVWQSNNYLRKV